MQPDFIFYGINGGPTALYQLPQPNIYLFWLVGSGNGNVILLSTKLKQNLGIIYNGSSIKGESEICPINEISSTFVKATTNDLLYDVWIHQRSYGLINIELTITGSTETFFTYKCIERKHINIKCYGFLKFLTFNDNIFVIDHLDNLCIFNSLDDNLDFDKTLVNLNRDKYGIPLVMKKIRENYLIIGTDGGYLLFIDIKIKKIIFFMKQEKISPIFGIDIYNDKIIVGTRSQKFWIGNFSDILNNISDEILYTTIPSEIPSKLTNLIIEPKNGKFFVVTCTDGRFFFCKESKNNEKSAKPLKEINYSKSTISSISWESNDDISAFNLLVGLREESKLCYWKFS
ncbi:WD40/YVTN repeat-like-containing domain and WD40-repeat-containing domain-containing protein [Strongyloides ratti]|uniref:WD40/YVTN repeat-like-containing domain and WD40-repeat-containing domain-containing protein n=1 Tax=Strongyloides ratti TaxID=34506 RepID=A0A090L4M8_STRRB|nr:WD40/YVTN repeat-like-containing domain and WD40-repeat-containing domain-containing protein [Strongyloides ratti]CEF62459.1 WD40/YVTN repeat-like-containing domain and WD40-repeat-containing domain-containing protein [Strongyloides ratti]